MSPSSETDLFDLRGPENLFDEVQKAFAEYYREPNSRLLLFLLFSLNHLREWIAGENYESLERKRLLGRTLLPSEELYYDLWSMKEFRTINALCNRSKHHNVERGGRTSVTTGMTVESPMGDSFSQVYYRIDGVDSRELFSAVIRAYGEWFSRNSGSVKVSAHTNLKARA